MNNKLCTENYCQEEFACKCGCGLNRVRPELLYLCEFVRKLNGNKPLPINSGTRCRKHNEQVGGGENSQHLLGTAADLSVDDPKMVYAELEKLFLYSHGLGLYETFIHVDIRYDKARW